MIYIYDALDTKIERNKGTEIDVKERKNKNKIIIVTEEYAFRCLLHLFATIAFMAYQPSQHVYRLQQQMSKNCCL